MSKIKFKKIPTSKGKGFCDDLWADMVKIRDGHKCIICGHLENLNSHHLVSRRVFNYRWNVGNGITICPLHHEFGIEFSAHTAPWALEAWMKENRQEQYALWVNNRNNVSASEESTDYNELYYNLELEYKKMTSNYFRIERIAPYILFINVEKIKETLIANSSLTDNKKISVVVELMKEFNIGTTAVKEFLKQNKFIQ